MSLRVVVVGGGAGGIGAAGGAKQAAPDALVTVFTEFEDVAYSPCGIPYVHGREIEDFKSLFLADKEAYVQAGIDIHYETRVTAVDLRPAVRSRSRRPASEVRTTGWCSPPASTTRTPTSPASTWPACTTSRTSAGR